MFDVVTIGDSIQDIFLVPRKEEFIKPNLQKKADEPLLCFGRGEKIVVEEVFYDIGGSACNVAVGLSRIGLNSAIISAVGDDQKAVKIEKKLAVEKVSLEYFKKIKKIETSFSIILLYEKERTILVYRGLKDYSKLKIASNLKTNWLYVGPLGFNFESIYHQVISCVCEKNIKLAINPGNLQIEKDKEVLNSILNVASILFLNREEAQEILKMPKYALPKDLLINLHKLGPEIVVMTDGKKGAYCYDGTTCWQGDPFPAQRVEVTGAGDAFASGFLAGIINNIDTKESLKWGLVDSASVVGKIGAQTNLLTKSKIIKDLNKIRLPIYKI
jgi:sugar/nucleoside kinase (ribokinase family)